MSKLHGKKAHDIPIHRLSSLCIGLTLIWIEDTSSFSRERDETLGRLCACNNCHIIRYTNVLKCLKYLNQAKAYERIVIIMTIDHYSINTSDTSRLFLCRQIQSIFMVPMVDGKDNGIGIDLLDNIRVEIGKICEIFHDYQSLFNRFQHLMNEADQFDDDFFVFFNRSEKLRNLHNELGPYIWSQSLRG
ncbi:unnamed protein product [Rotaria sp. Silwood1]|nr:unnamed protein product [Rotaria sp. Silwood1]